ncbi:MAG: twin arginine-targeting protein translocase TatC [Lentisphaerae bacterium GWF2_45_14]|nr:MAG: twin arginine-targeting protein translocase TatC [Lentisphaerae bacterium GWF2_45_14]
MDSREIERAPEQEGAEDRSMSIIDHLDELRTRLIRCTICILILSVVAYFFSQDIIEWLKREFCPELEKIVFTRPLELFMIRLKAALYLSILGGFPYLAFEIWHFVAPGLFPKERKYVSVFVVISSLLFATGGMFALFFIYPSVIKLSIGMASPDIVPMITVESFVNLAAMLVLGFGIMFQLPVFVFILAASGLVKIETMSKARPFVIVAIFIISAVLTPPDVVSQIAMALPSLVLFEISLLLARIFLRNKKSA